jgi:hypothetical protein
MARRIFATVVLFLFAVGGEFGIADGNAGPFNPFGMLFFVLAILVWRKWDLITGGYSPAGMDGMWGQLVSSSSNSDFYRAADDHYRRDGPQHYRETE